MESVLLNFVKHFKKIAEAILLDIVDLSNKVRPGANVTQKDPDITSLSFAIAVEQRVEYRKKSLWMMHIDVFYEVAIAATLLANVAGRNQVPRIKWSFGINTEVLLPGLDGAYRMTTYAAK